MTSLEPNRALSDSNLYIYSPFANTAMLFVKEILAENIDEAM